MYANAGLSVTTYNDELPEHPEFYELREKDCLGRSNVEYKMRGWDFIQRSSTRIYWPALSGLWL